MNLRMISSIVLASTLTSGLAMAGNSTPAEASVAPAAVAANAAPVATAGVPAGSAASVTRVTDPAIVETASAGMSAAAAPTVTATTTAVPQASAFTPSPTATNDEIALYGLAYKFAKSIENQIKPLKADLQYLDQGVEDSITGKPPQYTDAQIQSAMTELQKRIVAELKSKHDADAKDALAAGDKYLTEFAKEKGTKKLSDGVLYQELVGSTGKGKHPGDTDLVIINYVGKLIDGKTFDQGNKAQFPMSGLITGMKDALKAMHKGDHWKIVIPSSLAYGTEGAGELIGSNQALIFDIKLLEIKANKKH